MIQNQFPLLRKPLCFKSSLRIIRKEKNQLTLFSLCYRASIFREFQFSFKAKLYKLFDIIKMYSLVNLFII